MKNFSVVKIFLVLLFFPSLVWAVNDPTNMLQTVANQMITNLKKQSVTLKKNPAVVYSIAGKIIVPHADLTAMSKRVLPPATWNKATAAEKQQFEKVFTTTLIRTYASALAQYKDETVKFYPVRGGYAGKNRVRVFSQISGSEGPTIDVSYDLVLSGGEWKLYDMTVEGVSMLQSFQSQFGDELRNNNIAGLIKILQSHNKKNSGE